MNLRPRPQLPTLPRKPIAVPRTSPSSEGLRVSLKQREATEPEPEKAQQPIALDLAASNQSALAKKEYLQPRDIELGRPSSTPVSVPHSEPMISPKEDEKLMYQPQPIDHQTLEMLKDPQTLEMLKIRQMMFNQLMQAGLPEQAALQHLPTLPRDKFLNEGTSHSPIPSQVPALHPHHEDDRRQPMPAHSSVPYRQTDSPMFPVPAHRNSQLPYHVREHVIHPPPPSHHDIYSRPSEVLEPPPAAHSSQIKRLAHSGGVADLTIRSPLPVESDRVVNNLDLMNSYRMPHLAAYPICWTGILGLKNDMANVQMHYVSGCRDLAREYLPETGANLKIVQRMRLEDAQIDGVKKKMETKSEHCLLLALPHGNDQDQFESQSRILRNNFITYLQLKSAAGIANVVNADNQPAIVHVFPSCDFANENLAR